MTGRIRDGLNYRQILFVAEFMVDGHAGPAAIRAGYKPSSSDSQGVALLANPKVRAAIELKTAEKVARIEAKQAEAEARLADEGRVTVPWVKGLLYDTATRCSDPENYMPAQVLRAAELSGKHLSMFVDRVDLSANVTFNINLAAPAYFDDQVAGEVIEGEVINGGQDPGESGPERQLRADAGGSGQGESLGQGENGQDRGGPDDTETLPGEPARLPATAE